MKPGPRSATSSPVRCVCLNTYASMTERQTSLVKGSRGPRPLKTVLLAFSHITWCISITSHPGDCSKFRPLDPVPGILRSESGRSVGELLHWDGSRDWLGTRAPVSVSPCTTNEPYGLKHIWYSYGEQVANSSVPRTWAWSLIQQGSSGWQGTVGLWQVESFLSCLRTEIPTSP